MWLVKGIDAQMYNRMRRMGLKLKPEALYNEQSPALCDAVVAINGGMGSGSMISDEGLMITNHHVAYSAICAITTPEHNYLEDGFWAASRENEIPLEGFTVQFLRGIIDVTEEAAALRDSMIAEKKWNAMGTRRLGKAMQERYAKTTEFTPSFESMWGGKKYYTISTRFSATSVWSPLRLHVWVRSAAIPTTGAGPSTRQISPSAASMPARTASLPTIPRTMCHCILTAY